jgi:tetratricopeptide (TPR) repeat protein
MGTTEPEATGNAGGFNAPEHSVEASHGVVELQHILRELITHPNAQFGPLFDPDAERFSSDATFDSYCRAAVQLARSGELDVARFLIVRENSLGFVGDDADYATDLLRIVARELGDDVVLKQATEDHLRVLAEISFRLRPLGNNDPRAMRRARKSAQRGLTILEESSVEIDPDVHADLLIALAQTHSHPSEPNYRQAIGYFSQGLQLKKAARNLADVERGKELLGRIIEYQVKRARMGGLLGGLGEVLEDLIAAHAAAQALGDDSFECDVALGLSELYRRVRQPREAERVLRGLLEKPQLTSTQRTNVMFELASALSESKRAAEAAAIQQQLLDDPQAGIAPEAHATLWLNLGNSRRETGDIPGARHAFEQALAAQPIRDANALTTQPAAIRALLAQLDFLENNPTAGHARFLEARELIEPNRGVLEHLFASDMLHFHSLAARCYTDADMSAAATEHVAKARELLRALLSAGSRPAVWESMLQEWSYIDACEVKLQLGDDSPDARKRALLAAESAKGRLLAWLHYGLRAPVAASLRDLAAPAAEEALGLQRQEAALATVQRWLSAQPRRRVLSLFASERGLAVISLAADGAIEGKWLADFQHDFVLEQFVRPWEEQLEAAAAGPGPAWARAEALTDLLLDRTGEYLFQALPELIEGGDDLVLIPHRLFRSLPLSHARLPAGNRLSELFRRVAVVPSLHDFARSISANGNGKEAPVTRALVDADGTLPFARLEGLCVARGNALTEEAVTPDAVKAALAAPGTVLLSCHGDFREDDPWHSVIMTATGPLLVHEIVAEAHSAKAELLVLGVCEAGRVRRTVSDEPLGFPAIFMHQGVRTVIAPMWKVDDFASLFFITDIFRRIEAGALPAESVTATAHWLRELTAREALAYARSRIGDVAQSGTPAGAQAIERVRDRVDATEQWLQNLPETEQPFRSALDWAAFQVTGVPS